MSVVYGPWTAWYINLNNAFTTAQYDGMPSLLSSSPLFSSLLFCVLPIFCLFYIILFVLLVFFFHHLSKTCRIELLDARWIYRRTGTTIYSLPPPLSPFSLPLSPLSSLLSPLPSPLPPLLLLLLLTFKRTALERDGYGSQLGNRFRSSLDPPHRRCR